MIMEEYLDIVNEHDEVIGKDTRKNVHASHRIHRGVHVLVISSDGDILMQKRSEKKNYYPGYYDASVGAHLTSGETYEEAAVRETEEELGFVPKELTFICDYDSFSDRQKEKRRLFVCHFDGPFNIDKEELELVEWFSPERIEQEIKKGEMKLTEGFVLSFRSYVRHIN